MVVLNDNTSPAGAWRVVSFAPQQQPLLITANTGADAKVKIYPNVVTNLDGTDTNTPPISNNIASVPLSTHDLQSGATTGATFIDAVFPTSTVGYYRRFGYTLLTDGTIQFLFTKEHANLIDVDNAGTVFAGTGLPIGWVDVQATGATAFKTANSASNIVETMVSGTSVVHRFGSGGGGGSGTGDTFALLERFLGGLADAPFRYGSVIVAKQNQSVGITYGGSGAYNIVSQNYTLPSIGDSLQTINLLDTEWTGSSVLQDISTVGLIAYWANGLVDTAATYQVSRDGGVNWAPVTMNRIGSTSTVYNGVLEIPTEATLSTLSTYAVSNADTNTVLNATTQQQLSQPFSIAALTVVTQITAYLNELGSPTGVVNLSLVRDNAGQPSTNPLDILGSGQVTLSSLTWTSNNASAVVPTYAILPAGSYHLVLSTSGYTFNSGVTELRWRTDTSSPVGTTMCEFNGTSWSTLGSATVATYLIEGRTEDLRIKIIGGTAGAQLSAFGIKYDYIVGVAKDNVEKQTFYLTAQQDSFPITTFAPDADWLKVYVEETGQVFIGGRNSFKVSGYNVNFPAGTFASASPSNPLTVVFDQSVGGGFDGSDANAALLAENRLGSMNVNLDRSVAGEGHILRAAVGAGPFSGKRCEIWLDSYGVLQVTSLE